MSVNLTVTGNSFQEVKEQLRGLIGELNELEGKIDVATTRTASQTEQIAKGNLDGIPTGDPAHAIKQNVVKFPITPEINTSVAQTASPGEDLGVDSRGLPWDERIHSGNKEKGKDGVWRRRRGVDPTFEKQVEAELYAAAGKTSPTQVKPFGSMSPEQYQQAVQPAAPAPMPTTEHRAALPVGADLLSSAQIPATPAPTFAPPAPVQVLPPNTFTPETFRNNLVTVLNDLAAAGKINHDWINAQKQMFNGKDVTQWSENQASCNSLFEAFVQWGFVNKL